MQRDSERREKARQRKALMFVSPDRRKALWDLIFERGMSVREAQRLTEVPERQIIQVLKARMWEEINRAILIDRARRGPNPPAALRRAA